MSSLTKKLPIPKTLSIIIRVVLITIAALVLVWFVLFFISMNFTVDYVNAKKGMSSDITEEHRSNLEENSYEINYPFFGNSTLLAGNGGGAVYTIPSYLGSLGEYGLMHLMGAYNEINNPLDAFALMVSNKYDGRAKLDYTVENDGGQLRVCFDGVGYNSAGTITETINKEFVFDVKGASAFNPPKWSNRTSEDDYFANLEFIKDR